MRCLVRTLFIFGISLCLTVIFLIRTEIDRLSVPIPLKFSSPISEQLLPSKQSRNIQFFTVLQQLPSHKLCLVVPFRDRWEELEVFAPYMRNFLYKKNISHEILVINQVDNFRFNRASLINIGYIYSKLKLCDYIAMHDVDLLPLNSELDYSYPIHGPVHLASPDYHPRYNYSSFIGGILLINFRDFEKVNGMSNKYWGWGREDDELFVRFRIGNISLYRQYNLTTNRSNTFKHVHSWKVHPRDYKKYYNQRERLKRMDRVTGLDTVEYILLRQYKKNIRTAFVYIFDVKLFCDLLFTPWCTDPENIPENIRHQLEVSTRKGSDK